MLSFYVKAVLAVLLIFGPPVGVFATFPNLVINNPILYGFCSILWIGVTALAGLAQAVGDELRKMWAQSLAEWINAEVRLRILPFREKYYQQLKFRHRVFNVRGLRTQGTFTFELEKVFVDLRISPENPQAITADLLRQGPTAAKLSIWDLLASELAEYSTLAIIGPPGCGKTTLLQHLVLTFINNDQRKYNRRVRGYVPIFLFLRDHKKRIISDDPPSLAELATEQESKLNPDKDWFRRNLEDKNCLVLLDGLDEVANETERREVVTWVDEQVALFGGNHFIVTSRPFGYRSTPMKRAAVLEVQPFTLEQVKQFVENWYLANEILSFGKDDAGIREAAAKSAADMMHRLRTAPALTALAVNPLLLTMITMVHRYRGALPGRRVELYSEICDVLLGHWRSAIGVADPLSASQKRSVLQPLALSMMKSQQREIKARQAIEIIREPLQRVGVVGKDDPPGFLGEVEKESGLLLEREVGEYTFAHLTFQEYLASVQLLETNEGWCLEQCVDDSWWHETIRLYAAQTDATSIVRACLQSTKNQVTCLTLAYEISLEARNLDPEVRKQLEETILGGLESE